MNRLLRRFASPPLLAVAGVTAGLCVGGARASEPGQRRRHQRSDGNLIYPAAVSQAWWATSCFSCSAASAVRGEITHPKMKQGAITQFFSNLD
jgi:hypothetical protein